MSSNDLKEFTKRLKALTNEEVRELLIKAGIYDTNMNLMPAYKRGA